MTPAAEDEPKYVAILEDDARREAAMRDLLAATFPECRVVLFDNAPEMIAWLAEHLREVTLLCLDHDLGPSWGQGEDRFDPGCGRDVVDYLAEHSPCCPVVVHTTNSYAAPGMVSTLEGSGWSVERVIPFSDLEWISLAWIDALREQRRAWEAGEGS